MEEKNSKRKDILASARELFGEKGFHNTKMEEIALGAGVGKGTLYEYFKNKQEIFDETCEEYVKIFHESVEEISSMDITFKEKVILLFKEKEKSIDKECEKNPIDYIMSYKGIISEKVLKTMFEYISDMYETMTKIIEQGKKEGTVKKNIPSDVIACLIVGMIGEYFNLRMCKKDYVVYGEEEIFNLLFDGFGVK